MNIVHGIRRAIAHPTETMGKLWSWMVEMVLGGPKRLKGGEGDNVIPGRAMGERLVEVKEDDGQVSGSSDTDGVDPGEIDEDFEVDEVGMEDEGEVVVKREFNFSELAKMDYEELDELAQVVDIHRGGMVIPYAVIFGQISKRELIDVLGVEMRERGQKAQALASGYWSSFIGFIKAHNLAQAERVESGDGESLGIEFKDGEFSEIELLKIFGTNEDFRRETVKYLSDEELVNLTETMLDFLGLVLIAPDVQSFSGTCLVNTVKILGEIELAIEGRECRGEIKKIVAFRADDLKELSLQFPTMKSKNDKSTYLKDAVVELNEFLDDMRF